MDDFSKSSRTRHLDHLADMQEGEKFTMVPRCLSDAWLNGDIRMPDMKFKLLFCLMSHGPGFQVRASYLRERFHPKTLSKYIKELEAEGYIRVEKLKMERGGWENIHHVNSISQWEVKKSACSPVNARQHDECSSMNSSSVNSSSVNSSSVNTLNETNMNQNNLNKTKLAGMKLKDQPAKVDKRVVKLVEISQAVEAVLKPKGYVDYDATNLFIADLLDKHGESEVQSWIEWLRLNLSGAKWKRGTNWLTKLQESWFMYEFDQVTKATPKTDWGLMKRQAHEDRAANGSLDSFPF